ncbi:hypothetical protein Tco_0401097 [Tanacetum coccineum]
MATLKLRHQLLQAPTEGYDGRNPLIPEIVAYNFELKHGLINLVQNKQFFGHDKKTPMLMIRLLQQDHLSTMRSPMYNCYDKLCFFHPLRGSSPNMLEKEPPRSIQLGHLVFQIITISTLLLKRTNLAMRSYRFQQMFDESGFIRHGSFMNSAAGTNSFHPSCFTDVAELKDIVRGIATLRDKKEPASSPAPSPSPAKAVD